MHDSFLELIHSLLSGGEVSGVFSGDELDGICNRIKDKHSANDFRGSVYQFLVTQIRKHMHVVAVLDNSNKEFYSRCESNPALFTRCQMKWKDRWSPESVGYLAQKAFDQSPALQAIEDKAKLIKGLISIHESNAVCRGATPKHLTEYLAMYEHLYRLQRESLVKRQSYLEGGLRKLADATAYVDNLSQTAKVQKMELSEKERQANDALKEITDSMVEASEQKREMESLNESLAVEEEKMIIRKRAVEQELAAVEPLIRSAKEAVGDIRSDSLSEIRSLRAPPSAIRDVLEGLLRLMVKISRCVFLPYPCRETWI